MSENEESKPFLDDERLDNDKLFVAVPPTLPSPYTDKLPNPYDPMGEIYLQGKASRGLAAGILPWWVLMTGWIMFSGFTLLVLIEILAAPSLVALLSLLMPAIFLSILWRGTSAKLSREKRKRKSKRGKSLDH